MIDISLIINHIEKGFVLYSKGKVTVPPFGSLHFTNPPGDVHIKYGYTEGADNYVIKIASGFYENPMVGLQSSQGLMLIFNSKTGQLEAILLDEGYLTDYRTAVAGAIAAKFFAPNNLSCIGIIGTGTQARMQLSLLSEITSCRNVIILGRSDDGLLKFSEHPELSDYSLTLTKNIKMITDQCNLIVTTTPSTSPLLFADQIKPGTHITAVGTDSGGKQELDPNIFRKADIICNDSRNQCFQHGDTAFAIQAGALDPKKVLELGEVIQNPKLGRNHEHQITVVDLTGIAIQDIQIANAVYNLYKRKTHEPT